MKFEVQICLIYENQTIEARIVEKNFKNFLQNFQVKFLSITVKILHKTESDSFEVDDTLRNLTQQNNAYYNGSL